MSQTMTPAPADIAGARQTDRHAVRFTTMLLTAALLAAGFLAGALVVPAAAQETSGTALDAGSDNIEVLGHIPLGGAETVADIELEQEMHRPYAYVARAQYRAPNPVGTDIIDLSDPSNPKVIYEWRIENPELHMGAGALDVKYFKWDGRYYVVQAVQFSSGGPNADLGAVILDVTGLPDASTVREVARIREPEMPGGFHNIFVYKHSGGNVYLLTTLRGPGANVYDLGRVVEGNTDGALVANIPVPEETCGTRTV